MKPQWNNDGEPTNLEAAATDGLDWLRLLAHQLDNGRLTLLRHAENRRRLGEAIDNLQQFLAATEGKE